ncbi:MAG TPA: 1,3-1,4-beta-glycanase, partial [Microvirga sp.]|nr:1,3-1,4-beta-glycanase [Microvirga sp.]
VLFGGADADVFVFYRGNTGDDVINGFSFGEGDRIELDGQSYTADEHDGNLVLHLQDGGSITFTGLTQDQLQNAWFV